MWWVTIYKFSIQAIKYQIVTVINMNILLEDFKLKMVVSRRPFKDDELP